MGGLDRWRSTKNSLSSDFRQSICGNLLDDAITYAMATLETNASMGLIVASPTAGSAGIVPGLLLAVQKHYHFSDEQIQQALFNAGAIGYLAMRNATVAGAVGAARQRPELLLPWLLLLLRNCWVALQNNAPMRLLLFS